jgi:hypothetical protein
MRAASPGTSERAATFSTSSRASAVSQTKRSSSISSPSWNKRRKLPSGAAAATSCASFSLPRLLELVLVVILLGRKALHGLRHLFVCNGEEVARIPELLHALLAELERTPAAEQLEAGLLLFRAHAHDLDEADLARRREMRAAAGARIDAFDLDDADLAFVVLLAAVVHCLELIRRRQKGAHRHIGTNGCIGTALHVEGIFCREHAVEVDLDALLSHMEADVVVAEKLVHDARDDMLAGMCLHVVAAPGPVERAVYLRADRKRYIAEVHDTFFAAILCLARHGLCDMCDYRILALTERERAAVSRLAATRGIEGRLR